MNERVGFLSLPILLASDSESGIVMSNDDLKMYIKKHIDEIEDSSLLLFIYKLIINLI
jgi:hypothetical protein